MRDIQLPDELYDRLHSLTIPLLPTVPDVIGRLLEHYERTAPKSVPGRPARPVEDSPNQLASASNGKEVTGRIPRERGATIEIDNHTIRAVSVPDMYEQAMKYLVDNGYGKKLKDIVPMRTSSQRYLIAEQPKHPTGSDFVAPAQYGGFFMESHKDYRNAVAHLSQITEKLGLKLRYVGKL